MTVYHSEYDLTTADIVDVRVDETGKVIGLILFIRDVGFQFDVVHKE